MTDKELLEYAAKAADIEYGWQHIFDDYDGCTADKWDWNPLMDDGDAFRLMVKLKIDIRQSMSGATQFRYAWKDGKSYGEVANDSCAATRRAIVRAAASIGEALCHT